VKYHALRGIELKIGDGEFPTGGWKMRLLPKVLDIKRIEKTPGTPALSEICQKKQPKNSTEGRESLLRDSEGGVQHDSQPSRTRGTQKALVSKKAIRILHSRATAIKEEFKNARES